MRRALFALFAVAAVGCGLAFSPGDYGGTSNAADAAPTVDSNVDDVTTPADAALPTSHVLVLTGTDDGGAPTSDIWTATIAANGDIGPFVYNAPNLISGPVQAATILGSVLLLSTNVAAARVVEGPAWDGGIVPADYPRASVTTPNPAGYGQFFAGTSLVAVGGASSTTDLNGTVTTTYDPSLEIALAGGSAYSPTIASPTVLEAGVTDVVVATYNALVFINGAGDDPNQAAQIYVGRLDPSAGAIDVTAATPMTNPPQTETLHTPTRPMFCAGSGYLFVAGGVGSNVVLYAAIDEAAATLGPWKAGPALPAPLERAGCFAVNGKVYLVGGWAGDDAGAAATSQILRATIAADGTMTEWEVSAQSLPAPRLNVLALPY